MVPRLREEQQVRPAQTRGSERPILLQRLAEQRLFARGALGQLRGVRTANLRLWRSLTPAQLERVGLHSERGPESVDLVLRMMGGHDLVHRRQIDRVLAAAGVATR